MTKNSARDYELRIVNGLLDYDTFYIDIRTMFDRATFASAVERTAKLNSISVSNHDWVYYTEYAKGIFLWEALEYD